MQPLPKPPSAYVHTDTDKKSVPVVGINIRHKGNIVTRCQLKHSSGTILALFFFFPKGPGIQRPFVHELFPCRKKRKLEAVMGMMTVPLNRILVSSDLNR